MDPGEDRGVEAADEMLCSGVVGSEPVASEVELEAGVVSTPLSFSFKGGAEGSGRSWDAGDPDGCVLSCGPSAAPSPEGPAGSRLQCGVRVPTSHC